MADFEEVPEDELEYDNIDNGIITQNSLKAMIKRTRKIFISGELQLDKDWDRNFNKNLPVRAKILTTRFSIVLNKVELKNSNIHGIGVFAKQNIQKFEIITLYPGDYLHYKSQSGFMTLSIDPFVKNLPNSHDLLKDYAFTVDDKYSICGHPNFIDNMAYVGHMINDGAKSSRPEDEQIYLRASIAKSNSGFVSCDFSDGTYAISIVAIRNISVGEEIFIHYGYNYWTQYH